MIQFIKRTCLFVLLFIGLLCLTVDNNLIVILGLFLFSVSGYILIKDDDSDNADNADNADEW